MAETPTTAAPSPEAALKCTNGQTLAEVFRAQGSPFQIDMPKLQNNGQPLQKQIEGIIAALPEKAIIFTEGDFKEMFPDRRELDELFKKSPADFAADPKLMARAETVYEQYIDKMREEHPEVAAFNPVIQDHLIKDLGPSTLPEFTYAKIVTLKAWESSPMTIEKKPTSASETTNLLKLSDPKLGLQPAYESVKSTIGIPIAPPPGTPEQQSAITTMHELEHLAGAKQSSTTSNVSKALKNVISAECSDEPSTEAMSNVIIQAMESEAAISNVQATRDVVPEELARWKAAANIALANEENMTERGAATGAFDKHSPHAISGFAEYEYIKTGEVPDFYSTLDDVHNFYAKTGDLFRDSVEMSKAKAGIPENADIGAKPTIPLTMDVVRQALKADPPIYTPAEQVVAQNYLQAMGEDLGVQAQDLQKTLDAQAQEFKKTATPAPAVNIVPKI